MATNRIVTKALAGIEDLLVGVGVVSQTRSGVATNINKINASNLPYDATDSLRIKIGKKAEIVADAAALIAWPTSISADQYLYLLCHTTTNDGAGGLFWLDTTDTTTVEDLVNIFNPDVPGNGRWKRVHNDTLQQLTTAQRDALPTPLTEYIIYNTTNGRPEVYNGSAWVGLGGAAGAGGDSVFYENDQVVTTDYTLTAGKNAMSAGDITINTGVTVTVPTDAIWTVV